MTDNIFESYLSIIEAADNGSKGKAAAEAKKKGYKYVGWGKWSKGNMVVAKTVKDKLVAIKPEPIGKKGTTPAAKGQPKNVSPTQPIQKFANKLTAADAQKLRDMDFGHGVEPLFYAGISAEFIKSYNPTKDQITNLKSQMVAISLNLSNMSEPTFQSKSKVLGRAAFIKWADEVNKTKKGAPTSASPQAPFKFKDIQSFDGDAAVFNERKKLEKALKIHDHVVLNTFVRAGITLDMFKTCKPTSGQLATLAKATEKMQYKAEQGYHKHGNNNRYKNELKENERKLFLQWAATTKGMKGKYTVPESEPEDTSEEQKKAALKSMPALAKTIKSTDEIVVTWMKALMLLKDFAPEFKHGNNQIEIKAARKQSEWRAEWLEPEDVVKLACIQDDWQRSSQWHEGSSAKKSRNKYLNHILLGRDGKHPCMTTVSGPIYRGMSLSKKEIGKFLSGFEHGKIVHMPPSGFTTDPETAKEFAAGDISVVLRLHPNKKGQLIGLHCNEAHEGIAKKLKKESPKVAKDGIDTDRDALADLEPNDRKKFQLFSQSWKNIRSALEKISRSHSNEYIQSDAQEILDMGDAGLHDSYDIEEFNKNLAYLFKRKVIRPTLLKQPSSSAKNMSYRDRLIAAAEKHDMDRGYERDGDMPLSTENEYEDEHEIIRPSFGAVKVRHIKKIFGTYGNACVYIDLDEAGVVKRKKYIGEALNLGNAAREDFEGDPEMEMIWIKYLNGTVAPKKSDEDVMMKYLSNSVHTKHGEK